MLTIGILGLQGDCEKYIYMTQKAGAKNLLCKSLEEINKVDGLIIPGGESTTIGKLLERFSLLEPLRKKILKNFPVFGTCAGTILLAKKIEGRNQHKIGTLDITVTRNAYGPQVESFSQSNNSGLSSTSNLCFFLD